MILYLAAFNLTLFYPLFMVSQLKYGMNTMMRFLVIHGPNLNRLGQREPDVYGKKTLSEINSLLQQRGVELGIDIVPFQSNSEGVIIDFIQLQASRSDGIIINPGALTHYGLSLRDAIVDSKLPAIEIHLSNIYAREEWRAHSVIAPIARGQISGLGWRGFVAAIEILYAHCKEQS